MSAITKHMRKNGFKSTAKNMPRRKNMHEKTAVLTGLNLRKNIFITPLLLYNVLYVKALKL